MDAAHAFEVALDHYRKGENLLNYPEAVLAEEQALHFSRAAAHFAAGSLALGLGQAALQMGGDFPGEEKAGSGSGQ
ncbi:MAG TPA: hypothetical protein VMA95_16055 [Streptosporangiaceae bacterium]|nr:hypothetical protein [Streptosporangiaceae bacterium]